MNPLSSRTSAPTSSDISDRERGLIALLEEQRAANAGMMRQFEVEMAQMKRKSDERDQKLERFRLEKENILNNREAQAGQWQGAGTSSAATPRSLPIATFPSLMIPSNT